MKKYHCSGFNQLQAVNGQEAARAFAGRMAREKFGRKGYVRLCNLTAWSQDGTMGEFSAFIGYATGECTTGHNVTFTVQESNR